MGKNSLEITTNLSSFNENPEMSFGDPEGGFDLRLEPEKRSDLEGESLTDAAVRSVCMRSRHCHCGGGLAVVAFRMPRSTL